MRPADCQESDSYDKLTVWRVDRNFTEAVHAFLNEKKEFFEFCRVVELAMLMRH